LCAAAAMRGYDGTQKHDAPNKMSFNFWPRWASSGGARALADGNLASLLLRARQLERLVPSLAFTRYYYDQYCMVYSIQTGGRKGSCIRSNDRAIVSHQGGQHRWARGMKGWLIRALQPRSKRISCNSQFLVYDNVNLLRTPTPSPSPELVKRVNPSRMLGTRGSQRSPPLWLEYFGDIPPKD